MALITPIDVPHQAFMDALQPAPAHMQTENPWETLACTPDGIPFITEQHSASDHMVPGHARPIVPYTEAFIFITLKFAFGRFTRPPAAPGTVFGLHHHAQCVVQRLKIPTDAWMPADTAGRIALLQARVREVSTPRQQQLMDAVQRLARYRWTQLCHGPDAIAPQQANLHPDGKIHWTNVITPARGPLFNTSKSVSRGLLSRRRAAQRHDLASLVEDFHDCPNTLSEPLRPFHRLSLDHTIPALTGHANLALRQELVQDFQSLGVDIADHL